jgi:16S rRNA C967 or C1407 C5-methylase (RsmB/RsmF family)
MDFPTFAARFSLFTDPGTRAAIEDSGKLHAPAAAFVLPPAVTTLRLVHGPATLNTVPQVRELLDGLRAAGHTVTVGMPGLPDLVVVDPHPRHALQPNGVAIAAGAGAAATAVDAPESSVGWGSVSAVAVVTGRGGGMERDDRPVGIVVDAACGEAVLRGSHIFAPGIIASTRPYVVGDRAAVFAVTGGGSHGSKCPILKGSYVSEDDLRRSCVALVVGTDAATVRMDRQDVTKGGRGVAITIEKGGFGHPALGDLPAPLPSHLFLQNHSSLLPATLLDPKPGHAVLDMCAAPGGKASHVLSIVSRNARVPMDEGEDSTNSTASLLASSGFSLTCCERSASRCASLRGLLVLHHGEALVNSCVQVLPQDSNKLLQTASSSAGCYDRILLDPPCTGFGLRPRLRPHDHSLDAVKASADYQRKLLRTAAALVKVGGLVCYSTCTLSEEENEETVRWALSSQANGGLGDTFDLVLESTEHRALAAYAIKIHGDVVVAPRPEAGEESARPICWTFGPRLEGAPAGQLDSPGFFVSLLRRKA